VSILGMPTFCEPCNPFYLAVYFIRARILSCSSGPFLLYYATCWSDRGKEENCGWRERWKIDQSSITRRMVFHILFML